MITISSTTSYTARAATPGAGLTLSGVGTAVGGVTLQDGDRVLVTDSTWVLLTFVSTKNAAFSAVNPKFYLNGTQVPSTRGGGAAVPNIVVNHLRVGGNLAGSQLLSGKVAELLVLESSDSVRVGLLNQTLKLKYGL